MARLMPETNLIITVAEVKEYLRLDHDEDDVLSKELIEAAQEWAEEYCGHPLTRHPDIEGSIDPPKKFKLALRQLVAHWYENRSIIATGNIPREVPFMVSTIFDQSRRIPL